MKNIYSDIPDQMPEELTETLLLASSVRIERIVSDGHASDVGFWYDQDEHEWVLVIQGEASIEFDTGGAINMTKGDYVLIPAHQKHRVKSTSNTEKTIWLAVFYNNENANNTNERE